MEVYSWENNLFLWVIFHGYVSHNQRVKPVKPLVFQQKKGEHVVLPSAPNFFAAPRFLALRYGAWVARSSPQRFGLNLIDIFQENVTHSLLSSCSFPEMAVRYPPLTDSLGLSHRCKYEVAPCTLKKNGYTLLVQCLQNWNISKLCREKQQTASWQCIYIYMFI